MSKRVGLVVDMSYHRNGVSGRGFWTILFEGAKGSDIEGESFVATYFPGGDEICTAVLRLDPLIAGNADNCMRGDTFHDELKALVDNYEWPHERRERMEREGLKPVNRRAAIEHTKAKG